MEIELKSIRELLEMKVKRAFAEENIVNTAVVVNEKLNTWKKTIQFITFVIPGVKYREKEIGRKAADPQNFTIFGPVFGSRGYVFFRK